ncbi:hypothetical protein PSCICJ_44720 [Pseudomonas cichorii]|nr:hypothetical protein PSCICJ_44720 [Pseudomonas cichorii]
MQAQWHGLLAACVTPGTDLHRNTGNLQVTNFAIFHSGDSSFDSAACIDKFAVKPETLVLRHDGRG